MRRYEVFIWNNENRRIKLIELKASNIHEAWEKLAKHLPVESDTGWVSTLQLVAFPDTNDYFTATAHINPNGHKAA